MRHSGHMLLEVNPTRINTSAHLRRAPITVLLLRVDGRDCSLGLGCVAFCVGDGAQLPPAASSAKGPSRQWQRRPRAGCSCPRGPEGLPRVMPREEARWGGVGREAEVVLRGWRGRCSRSNSLQAALGSIGYVYIRTAGCGNPGRAGNRSGKQE
jgi:hypothetical protein